MIQPAYRSANLGSDFLNHLIEGGYEPGDRLPAIPQLAKQLEISSGKLREQLEVARTLGLVEVRPKTGIRFTGFDFAACVQTSLRFALALDRGFFDEFGRLRNLLEAAFWFEAVRALDPDDLEYLGQLVEQAWDKLRGDPIEIPHMEHRELHMTLYSRLENPFVRGLLEAYWAAYEAAELNLYEDYAYLQKVWSYHEKMVTAIVEDDVEAGYAALVEHTELLKDRPVLMGAGRPEPVLSGASESDLMNPRREAR